MDPLYFATPDIASTFRSGGKASLSFGEIIDFIDSGKLISNRLDENGIHAFEVNHILPNELKMSQVKVVSDGMRILRNGDILTGRVGSLGAFAPFQGDYPATFSDNVLRIRLKDSQMHRRSFLVEFLNSEPGTIQVLRGSRGALQKVVTQGSLSKIIVPTLGDDTERILAGTMEAARAERKRKLKEADGLLNSLDSWLLDKLGITPPPEDKRKVYAVQLQKVDKRIDAEYYSPTYQNIRGSIEALRHFPLGKLTLFSNEVWDKKDLNQEEQFRYIEISGVNRYTGEAVAGFAKIGDAPSRARKVVKTNDIIVSLTRPHHGSIAQIDETLNECIASTGFSVLRFFNEDLILPTYLWAILRTQILLLQMKQRSSGGNYPAITEDELANILIPVPEKHIQETIIAEVDRRRITAKQLKAEAEQGWEEAKKWFENELLGGDE